MSDLDAKAKAYVQTISGPDVELQSGRILSHLIQSAFKAGAMWAWGYKDRECPGCGKKFFGNSIYCTGECYLTDELKNV